jgi:carboxymethylenebutenolidase
VVVIHENRGLTDWVRSVADQLAEAGYIAIAPDLLSGTAPGGGKTSDFASGDAAREAIGKLPPDQVTADLNAVADYVGKLPAANGKVAVAGSAGAAGRRFGLRPTARISRRRLCSTAPGPSDAAAVARIQAPDYGFYGGLDARVNATITTSEELMKAAGKSYEPVIYDGAGHGFMRAGEEPDASAENKKAREDAWVRWKKLLAGIK